MRTGLLSVALVAASRAAAPAVAQCTPEWLPLDIPTNPSTGEVNSVTEWDPDGPGPASSMLVAGGRDLLGADHMVAAWDGLAWGPLGSGLRPTATWGHVRSMATFEGSVIAGGIFETIIGGQWVYSAARWDGTAWSSMGGGFDITAMLVDSSGRLAATSYPTGPLYIWNGGWVGVGAHTSQYGYALVEYGDELIVGGSITPLATWNSFAVGHWTGSDWAPYGEAFGGQLYSAFAMAVYQGEVIATDYASGTLRKWNGAAWQAFGNPFAPHAFSTSCLLVYNGDLFAAQRSFGVGRVARYAGSNWEMIGATDTHTQPSGWDLTLGVYQGDLIVAGAFQSIGGIPALNVARWRCAPCYANCDRSGAVPVLNINDFVCFMNRFGAGDSYANCDGSTSAPVLNVNDFVCFQQRFAAGCE